MIKDKIVLFTNLILKKDLHLHLLHSNKIKNIYNAGFKSHTNKNMTEPLNEALLVNELEEIPIIVEREFSHPMLYQRFSYL